MTLLLVLALASYHPGDPSLDTAAGGPAQNLLGAPGAIVADFLLALAGWAVVLMLPLGLIFGVRLWRDVPVGRWRRMLWGAAVGVVLIATALSYYETLTNGHDAWFDGSLMLIAFLLAGRVLDAMMRDRARSGVDALLGHAPRGAMVVGPDGSLGWVAAEDLCPGAVMRIAATAGTASDDVMAGSSDTPSPAPTRPRAVSASSPSNVIRGSKPAARHRSSVIVRRP